MHQAGLAGGTAWPQGWNVNEQVATTKAGTNEVQFVFSAAARAWSGALAVVEVDRWLRRHALKVLPPIQLLWHSARHCRRRADEHALYSEQVPAHIREKVCQHGWLADCASTGITAPNFP